MNQTRREANDRLRDQLRGRGARKSKSQEELPDADHAAVIAEATRLGTVDAAAVSQVIDLAGIERDENGELNHDALETTVKSFLGAHPVFRGPAPSWGSADSGARVGLWSGVDRNEGLRTALRNTELRD